MYTLIVFSLFQFESGQNTSDNWSSLAKMGQSCTSFRYCFFETSENDGTLEVQVNPRQIEKRQVEKPQKKVRSR